MKFTEGVTAREINAGIDEAVAHWLKLQCPCGHAFDAKGSCPCWTRGCPRIPDKK